VRLLGAPPSIGGRRRVGYVPQTLGLYAGLTAGENWSFAASAFRFAGTAPPAVISACRDELVGRLPLGEQRRVAFAIALAHHPELLVLDEPTSGVGPLGGVQLWDEIRQAAAGNTGVLVTTHNMEEAEQCDRLVIMSGGKVVAEGTSEAITGQHPAAEVRCGDRAGAFAVLDAGGFAVQLRGSALRVASPAPKVAARLSEAGIDATVDAVPANLEEVFADIIARK
jgi:ABC-2 type transport system ATP-binding protein/ribosome-dependent ATPase